MWYILTNDTLTVIIHGRPRSLHRTEARARRWEEALEAVENDDEGKIEYLLDLSGMIDRHFEGTPLSIQGDTMYYRDEPLHSYAAQKAIEFVEQDLPHLPLINFIHRLQGNPSYRAVQDLYQFLEVNSMPLTSDGKFLAYKKVRRVDSGFDGHISQRTYKLVDIHSGTMLNDVGTWVTMSRNQVDEDPDHTCSHGLHVCSYQYLPSFGSGPWHTVVVVKVDPADVVAVPKDYANAKMRVCAYEVVQEIGDYTENRHYWGDRAVVDDFGDGDEERDPHAVAEELIDDFGGHNITLRLYDRARINADHKGIPRPVGSRQIIVYLLEHGDTEDSLRAILRD